MHLLHNQAALLTKGALLFRGGKVAISIPCHLDQQLLSDVLS